MLIPNYQPTQKQLAALRLIATWSDGPPRISKLTGALGLANDSVTRSRLKPLREHGLLRIHREKVGYPDDLIVTAAGRRVLGLDLPQDAVVIKGSAPLGYPIFAAPCGDMAPSTAEPRYAETLSDIFPNFRNGDFLMDAEGDSMVSANDAESIYHGDVVHLRPGLAPANGETVYAEYELPDAGRECAFGVFSLDERTGEVTLKKLNPAYDAIKRPGQGVIVHGIVISTVRRYRGSNRK